MSLRLTVSNISKSYHMNPVLKGCAFSFEREGIYILMGPNGSGKSTFLRICALIEEPDRGEIDFAEVENVETVKKDISLRRRITLVLPRIGVFNATVFKNVAYGLKARGMRNKAIVEKANRVLEIVGLSDKKESNAASLSSGETQRLGIARAIVAEPEILFLDEPTASLDPYSTRVIEEVLVNIREQKNIMIIMVTHNLFQAQRLADHVLFMYEGRIVDHGSKKAFFENPKDERARRFITGQMVY
jgi:ABC-type phosphate transport system ATPase subunit